MNQSFKIDSGKICFCDINRQLMRRNQSNKQEILIFFSHYDYPRGGEKYLYELIQRISSRYSVQLFVESISPDWKKLYKRLHVSIHLLWQPKKFYWALLPITLLVNAYFLHKTIHKRSVILAANFPLTYLATLVSTKTIIFCFEPFNIFYDKTFIRAVPFWSQIILYIIKVVYSPFDILAVQSGKILATLNSSVEKAMRLQYKKPADIYIPNGVDTDFFSPTALPLFSFKERGRFVIGHSTDYTPLKGTEYLLSALPEVIKHKKSVLVLISETIFNPQKRATYQKIISTLGIQKNVLFVGTIPQNKLPGFYTSCNIFCFCGSSFCAGAYTASLSVLEAQACGLPVLRTSGNNKEIRGGITGVFIHPERTTLFSKQILSLITLSKPKIRTMQRYAQKHAETFSWKISSYQLIEAIKMASTPQAAMKRLLD